MEPGKLRTRARASVPLRPFSVGPARGARPWPLEVSRKMGFCTLAWSRRKVVPGHPKETQKQERVRLPTQVSAWARQILQNEGSEAGCPIGNGGDWGAPTWGHVR